MKAERTALASWPSDRWHSSGPETRNEALNHGDRPRLELPPAPDCPAALPSTNGRATAALRWSWCMGCEAHSYEQDGECLSCVNRQGAKSDE
jgi:hypothetical protein